MDLSTTPCPCSITAAVRSGERVNKLTGVMDEPEEFKSLDKLNVWNATWALFTSADRFAVIDRERVEQSYRRVELQMLLPALGKEPHRSSEAGRRLTSDENVAAVRGAVATSFAVSTLALACALLAATIYGAVNMALPFHLGKALQTGGGFLAMWGTLLAVNGPARTWSGWNAAERVHTALFTFLLASGGAIAIVGSLISP